ncbi:PEP-CTERM sorting domain-containing protein [Singulisphaera sp. Ch08]|uniref:PEP-CTERM sorting domain-containing protein n=1 Tax=Singulisphaera sp. Ch08 TaxID=3120278 RepID=A0AAU7C5R7_9BACT
MLKSRLYHWLPAIVIVGTVALPPANADSIKTSMAGSEAWGNSGNGNPFNGGEGWVFGSGFMRTQQIYDISSFQTPITSPAYVTQIAFRSDANPFTVTYPDMHIELSTTTKSVDGLSVNFAENTGADSKVVYEGALPLFSMERTGNPALPGPFDIVINLQHPFLYDPSAGHLLLDIINPSGQIRSSQFDSAEGLGDFVSRVYSYTGQGSLTTGFADSIGLITQFTFSDDPTPIPQPERPTVVPEPSSLATFGLTLVAAAFAGRRRRRSTGSR